MRPSPLSLSASGRQSPFKRQNSVSPATTVRASTPSSSPNKSDTATLSPTKTTSLSPEKASPFVRRPSQLGNGSAERPSSPFARPTSGLGVPSLPSKQGSNSSSSNQGDQFSLTSRQRSVTPVPETQIQTSASESRAPAPASPSPFDGASGPSITDSPTSFRMSNGTSTIRSSPAPKTTTNTPTQPPVFALKSTVVPKPAAVKFPNAGAYNHVSQPLLRSMRESFEVLDSSNSGAITSASVQTMLEQIGLDATSVGAMREFFPANGPPQLNLARYLDMLSAPLADLSQSDELAAAFSAFDVDDSGQIDVMELRKALLDTPLQPGEETYILSERDIDGILAQYAGRRAFGAKGLNFAKTKGEVFRYRDFMANITGAGADAVNTEAAMVA